MDAMRAPVSHAVWQAPRLGLMTKPVGAEAPATPPRVHASSCASWSSLSPPPPRGPQLASVHGDARWAVGTPPHLHQTPGFGPYSDAVADAALRRVVETADQVEGITLFSAQANSVWHAHADQDARPLSGTPLRTPGQTAPEWHLIGTPPSPEAGPIPLKLSIATPGASLDAQEAALHWSLISSQRLLNAASEDATLTNGTARSLLQDFAGDYDAAASRPTPHRLNLDEEVMLSRRSSNDDASTPPLSPLPLDTCEEAALAGECGWLRRLADVAGNNDVGVAPRLVAQSLSPSTSPQSASPSASLLSCTQRRAEQPADESDTPLAAPSAMGNPCGTGGDMTALPAATGAAAAAASAAAAGPAPPPLPSPPARRRVAAAAPLPDLSEAVLLPMRRVVEALLAGRDAPPPAAQVTSAQQLPVSRACVVAPRIDEVALPATRPSAALGVEFGIAAGTPRTPVATTAFVRRPIEVQRVVAAPMQQDRLAPAQAPRAVEDGAAEVPCGPRAQRVAEPPQFQEVAEAPRLQPVRRIVLSPHVVQKSAAAAQEALPYVSRTCRVSHSTAASPGITCGATSYTTRVGCSTSVSPCALPT
eukprot:NODE_3322_length_2053_cov_6.340602.p1 GENE.NODE_3322_length_2053_cov_6.340602~~NODE_3322_length_2053_cov_6.340602.p1  ORF type:complete len:591 (-),score=146.91 NODE_3322_length_2053_cov_6.340602:242-2014(-)